MGTNKLEPMQYYMHADAPFFFARRGDMRHDIYRYEEGKWVRYSINDDIWYSLDEQISRGRDFSQKELREAGIPLLQDDTPDITNEFFAEANKKKGASK